MQGPISSLLQLLETLSPYALVGQGGPEPPKEAGSSAFFQVLTDLVQLLAAPEGTQQARQDFTTTGTLPSFLSEAATVKEAPPVSVDTQDPRQRLALESILTVLSVLIPSLYPGGTFTLLSEASAATPDHVPHALPSDARESGSLQPLSDKAARLAEALPELFSPPVRQVGAADARQALAVREQEAPADLPEPQVMTKSSAPAHLADKLPSHGHRGHTAVITKSSAPAHLAELVMQQTARVAVSGEKPLRVLQLPTDQASLPRHAAFPLPKSHPLSPVPSFSPAGEPTSLPTEAGVLVGTSPASMEKDQGTSTPSTAVASHRPTSVPTPLHALFTEDGAKSSSPASPPSSAFLEQEQHERSPSSPASHTVFSLPARPPSQDAPLSELLSSSRTPTFSSQGDPPPLMSFENLARSLTKNPSTDTVMLRLEPPHLGHLRVQVHLAKDRLSATFWVQSSEAQHLLQSQLPLLHQVLNQQGFPNLYLSVSFATGSFAAFAADAFAYQSASQSFSHSSSSREPPLPRRRPPWDGPAHDGTFQERRLIDVII